MRKVLYGVYDRTSRAIISEFIESDDEPAIRSFVFSIGSNPFYRSNAQDFSLRKICIYDTDDGSVAVPFSPAETVCHCSQKLIESFFNREEKEGDK